MLPSRLPGTAIEATREGAGGWGWGARVSQGRVGGRWSCPIQRSLAPEQLNGGRSALWVGGADSHRWLLPPNVSLPLNGEALGILEVVVIWWPPPQMALGWGQTKLF